MKKREWIEVYVGDKDLKYGEQCSTSDCPAALAVGRTLIDLGLADDPQVEVLPAEGIILVHEDGAIHSAYYLPISARDRIHRLDRIDDMRDVRPFTFKITRIRVPLHLCDVDATTN